MGPVLRLSLRQLAGVRRLLIVSLLTLLPVALALAIRFGAGDDAETDDVITGVIDAILVAGILPLVTMALATASFGNELEDKTLSYIMLKPLPRWKIALPKLIAPILVAGPLVVISGAAAAYIGLDSGFKTPLAVGAALLVGVVAYSRGLHLGRADHHPRAFLRHRVRVPLGGSGKHFHLRSALSERARIHAGRDARP